MQSKPQTFEWNPEGEPAFLLGRAARLFQRRADERLRKLGFAGGQIPVIRGLRDGAGRTQRELADLAGIEQPTMALLLKRMERDGVVKRSANPADKRSTLFALSPRALAKASAAREVMSRGSDELLAGLRRAEVDQLRALLARLVANLEEEE